MRIILLTGKGGVGKSTLAASTAALAASQGHRTLVLSTDAAHSLADAFGAQVGSEPTEVGPRLYVEQIDAQRRFEESWAEVQQYLLSVLDVAGLDPVAAEELTVLPGAEEVLALLELHQRAASRQWDVIVIDCAPTAETLRLLALPEALGWYMSRIFPMQRRVVKALNPVLTRAAGVPMPGQSVFDAMERLHEQLLAVRDLLAGPDASVRIVLTPETVVVAEARRSWTMLSLYGYRVDGVIANRIFPSEGADSWRQGWVRAQADVLADVEASFAGLPIWRSVYRAAEPVGVSALETLAREVFAGSDPFAPATTDGPFRLTRTDHGAVARLALPGVDAGAVDLVRHGDDLAITVGSYRRLLTLPSGLARCEVRGAGRTGRLRGRTSNTLRGSNAGRRAVNSQAEGGSDGVGSAAEEAARLLGALSGWATDQVDAARDHLATGSPECSYCPLCRTVHAIREVSPEVREHLVSAGASLVQAMTGLITAASAAAQAARGPADGSGAAGGGDSGVERIRVDQPDDTDPAADNETDVEWPDL